MFYIFNIVILGEFIICYYLASSLHDIQINTKLFIMKKLFITLSLIVISIFSLHATNISGSGSISKNYLGNSSSSNSYDVSITSPLLYDMQISFCNFWEDGEGILACSVYDNGTWTYYDVDPNDPLCTETITVGNGAIIWYEYAGATENDSAFGSFDYEEVSNLPGGPGEN